MQGLTNRTDVLYSDNEPKDAVIQLPIWAAKIALRIAGLERDASHSLIIVRDSEQVRYSIDSTRFERVKINE